MAVIVMTMLLPCTVLGAVPTLSQRCTPAAGTWQAGSSPRRQIQTRKRYNFVTQAPNHSTVQTRNYLKQSKALMQSGISNQLFRRAALMGPAD